MRQVTRDRRLETGDRRRETGDRRQETGDGRQEAGDRRKESVGVGQEAPLRVTTTTYIINNQYVQYIE